ncbi:DNA/RNA non-specific endonuclease [Zavarzinella formosa]|uniref:DNA/RNA non-specific endonuclease n=1 Tax=Zavarzinella formosa TaxID=360055 RepID=UPI0012F9C10F|nr:DNA/RNA non-specific endonuclease [Zavarzinella formosa]
MKHLLLLFLILGTAAPVFADEYPHLFLGNPSNATEDKAKKENFLLKKEFFALSYNDTRREANWVSWRTTKEDTIDKGDGGRKRTFSVDTSLPSAFYHVTHKDYAGFGFDRGHLCPHSDRVSSREASYSTFVTTNIIPQTSDLNQKCWNTLEVYARDQVKKHANRRLYTIAGPAGKGGGPKDEPVEGIGLAGKIVVPAKCWKIIVIVDGDDDPDKDLEKIDDKTRVIAAIFPNETGLGLAWAKYRTSVAEVEKLTGLTFFDRVPEKVRKVLRETVDNVKIPAPKKASSED